mgnify:CR=1 FL=1
MLASSRLGLLGGGRLGVVYAVVPATMARRTKAVVNAKTEVKETALHYTPAFDQYVQTLIDSF